MNAINIINNKINKLREDYDTLEKVGNHIMRNMVAGKLNILDEILEEYAQQASNVTDEDIKKQAHAFMAEDDEWLDIQHNFSIVELAATVEHLTDFGIFLIKAMRDGAIKKSN